MRRSNEQSIKEVINELIEGNHMKVKLAEVTVINNWENLVGKLIAKQTDKIYFSKGKLIIHIASAPLRNELNYTRSKIVQIVNDFARLKLIEDVVVR